MIPQSEADLKRTCKDYLRYGMNQGKWWFTPLNSGKAYVKKGSKYYAIQLCEEGTADLMVIQRSRGGWEPMTGSVLFPHPIVIFIELKSAKGRTSPAQNAFQKIVEAQGCSYFIVRDLEELREILK